MDFNKLMKMKLQMFAEPEAGDGSNPGEPEEPTDPAKPADEPKDKPENKPEAKYTDDDVDKIINKKFAAQKTTIEELKEELEELRTKSMSDDEVKTYRQKKAEKAEEERLKSIEEREKTLELREQTMIARDGLSQKGVSQEYVRFLIDTGEFKSIEDKLEAFVDLFVSDLDAGIEEGVTKTLAGKPPRVITKNGPAITKQQIMEIKDPVERQKKIAENPQLFKR